MSGDATQPNVVLGAAAQAVVEQLDGQLEGTVAVSITYVADDKNVPMGVASSAALSRLGQDKATDTLLIAHLLNNVRKLSEHSAVAHGMSYADFANLTAAAASLIVHNEMTNPDIEQRAKVYPSPTQKGRKT